MALLLWLGFVTAKQNHLNPHFFRNGKIPSFRIFFLWVMVVLDCCAASSVREGLLLLSQDLVVFVNLVVLAYVSHPQTSPWLM